MVKGKEYRSAIEKYRDGCNKKCKECVLFTNRNRCVFEAIKSWQKWADEEHKNFKQFVREHE